MAVTKVLARNFTIEIESAVPDTFVPIKGLNSLTFTRGKEETDTTDFDNAGRASHLVSGRNMEIAIEGFFLEDMSTGDQDPGQEAVETLADAIGPESLKKFRLTTPGGTKREFLASAEIGDIGGGVNDAASWSANLVVSGEVTKTPAV